MNVICRTGASAWARPSSSNLARSSIVIYVRVRRKHDGSAAVRCGQGNLSRGAPGAMKEKGKKLNLDMDEPRLRVSEFKGKASILGRQKRKKKSKEK